MTMKILVTGAGALLGQGIIRALRQSTLKTTLIAADPNPLSVGLYWADKAYLVPMAKAPDYLPRMQEILHSEKPDLVLVGTDVELVFFAAHRAELERAFNTQILVSDSHVVAIADDKWLTSQFMKENGFDYPESCLPGDEDRLIDKLGFPLVVKPRIGARAIGVHKVHNREELRAALQSEKNAVIQECIGSDDSEYTAGTLYFDGGCAASIVMRRELRDGNTYRAFVDHYPALNEVVRAWAECLKAHGPANFQFRIDGQGRAKVFEINGRFSGTTPLRGLAGFNEVEMCVRRLLLNEPVRQPVVEPKVILRYWSEIVVGMDDVIKTP